MCLFTLLVMRNIIPIPFSNGRMKKGKKGVLPCCLWTNPVYYGCRTTGKPKDITRQTNNVFTHQAI